VLTLSRKVDECKPLYAGGFTPNPTYEEACSGQSGHTEAVQIAYDPKVGAYTRPLFSST